MARVDACLHLAFVFVGEAGVFEYRSVRFVERTKRRRVSELDLDALRGLLRRIGHGNELLALEITHGGMPCGPLWTTDVYGFDFGTVGAEDDGEDEGDEEPGDAVPGAA